MVLKVKAQRVLKKKKKKNDREREREREKEPNFRFHTYFPVRHRCYLVNTGVHQRLMRGRAFDQKRSKRRVYRI